MQHSTENHLKRVYGAWRTALGAALLIASFVLPGKLQDYVNICYPLTHSFAPHTTGDLAKCQAAQLVVQLQWVGVLAGAGIAVWGLVLLVLPQHTDD